MADFDYFPFEEGNGAFITEPRWTDMFTWMRTVGVLSEDTTLAPDAELAVNAISMSVGTQVQVEDGEAFIQGFMFIQTNGPEVIDIPLNESGDPRIDLLVLRLDKENNIISYVDIEGDPDPSPVPPDPIQNSTIWDLPLAEIAVADGATEITAMDITDVRVRSMQGDGGSTAVTLTSSGGDETLVAAGNAPPDLKIKGITAGTNIALTSDGDQVTIEATGAGADVTLDSAGGVQTLVSTGTGPNLEVFGLTEGANIDISESMGAITIAASSTPSNSPICVLRRNANLTVNNAATPIITWTTAVTDPYSMWNGTTTITIAEDGWYAMTVNITWTGDASANGSLLAYTTKVGTRLAESRVMMVGAENVSNNLCTIANLVATDEITVVVTNNTGVNLTMPTGGSYTPVFSLWKIRS